MGTIRKQYYGIKFPFTANNLNEFFLDLNIELKDKVASEIAHVLLTPKRTRIRKPDFGTDLIKYIFEANDELTFDDIKKEAQESVSKYVPNVVLDSIEVVSPPEDPNSVYLDLIYTVTNRNRAENNRLGIKLK